ncbi:MAG: hypothetical protein ACYC54_14065, partial [Sedimentisphaerales bacterium]
VVEDTFSGSSLNPMWSWEQSAGTWSMSGTDWRSSDTGEYEYAHLQTPIVVGAAGARADAVMRQYYGASSWGMGVGIYFDHDNFIAIKQGAANGQSGWLKYGFVNGVNVYSMLEAGPDLYSYFLVSGVEITATQINFYGSSINPLADHWGETGATALASEHLLGTMARPASFTGNALVIIGKGYESDASYALNPDWDNTLSGSVNFGWNMVDYARIETASDFFLPMDFDQSYRVDFEDFAEFAMQWMQCSDPNNSNCDQYWKTDTFEVWEIDPYINIVKTQAPPSSERLSSFSMQMAKNEYRDEVFMVSNKSATDIVNLEITVQPLGGLPANAILVEQTLYTKNKSSVETADGVYPLTGSVEIPTGQSRQFRLRFDSRFSGIAAGNYSFNVMLKDVDGGMWKTLPGTLQVWNIQLPGYDVLPNNTWAELANVELGQPAVLPGAVQEMKKYGLNQVFITYDEIPNASSVDDNGNILTFNTTAFDARVSAIKSAWDSGSGTDKLQWIVSLSSKITGPYSLGMNRGDIVFPSALWQTVYGQYLSLLKARFAYHGIAVADWMLAFADESGVTTLQTLEIPVAEFTKAADPTIGTICNSSAQPGGSYDARYLAAFDVFQPHFDSMVANPSILTWLKTSGKPIWTYKTDPNMSIVGKNVYDYYRVYAWNLLKYGYNGTGLWTYSAQGGGPSVWEAQTYCYLLAFKHYANDDVVHARRYEMYREGSDDYRYVSALRGIAAIKGRTAEAETLIQQAITDITANVTDTSRCEYWRSQIAQKILTYQAL